MINKEIWDGFPPELQTFITQENVKAAYNIWNGYLQIEGKAGDLIAAGDEIHTNDVSAIEPVARKQRESFIAALAGTAPPAVTHPQAFVDAYRKRIAYWTEALTSEGYAVTERTPEAIATAFAGLKDVDLSAFYKKFDDEVTPTLTK